MNPLPQLRTVRDTPAPATQSLASGPTPAQGTPTPPPLRIPKATTTPVSSHPATGLNHPRLTPAGRALLAAAVQSGLMTSEDVDGFLSKTGDRIPQLTTTERVAEALVLHGFLTNYQATRLLAGQTFGLVLGPYRLLDRLGGGTVSAVFLAEHQLLGRRVAVKVLVADASVESVIRHRFLQECKMLARLNHPHLLAVWDAGVLASGDHDEQLYYVALELARGGDLEQRVYQEGAQPVSRACHWIRAAALGLMAAHAAGIVHRDLKPSNMLLTEEGQVKLSDFGLARNWSSTQTPAHVQLGTLGFSAPEQIEDSRTVSPPADVFSLGVSLFWMLTGQLPYPQTSSHTELMNLILEGKPRRVNELLPMVPAPLDELIARMLHRVPSQRPTAEQVARELETWIEVELKLEAIPPIQPQSVSSYAVLQVMQASLARRLAPHSGRPQRMAKYAEALAKHLAKYPGWETLADEKRIEELGHLAAIHDLGWLAVPQSSSARPTAATTEKLHTMLAEGLLGELTAGHQASLPFLRLARQIVRSHHERWDGQGFPDGLRGEAIPRMARIVALADAYDTLRTGHDHATATAELRGEAGTRFDPVVIEAFRRWSREWDAIYLSVPDPIDK